MFNDKFLTYDLETRVINNRMTPYCCCTYDGKNKNSFYLTDFIDVRDMLINSIKSLLIRKYNNYKIYVHNLSKFDAVFLLRVLAEIPNLYIDPIIRDGRIINIKMSYLPTKDTKKPYVFEFRDSLLLLPSSLKNLAITFKVDNKDIFPYEFLINTDISLNYIGAVPEFKYFKNISIEEYNKYKEDFINKDWNLRDETIKYCMQDCISLYQVIDKFNSLVFDKWLLNVHRFPTSPSLTFGFFKSHYLKKDLIPKISGHIYQDIKKGYTGGHTDVYIPFGENVKGYDVNSLYPTQMKIFYMPVGTPTFFEGDITKIDPNAFGFFNVEITAPIDMNRPILQTKVKTKTGFRTIAPLGTWEDMIFSEEMYNAMKYGYKFKILSGYTFYRANIFKEYIEDLYKIKVSHSKNDPMYIIAKLLMNSLYGRFAMKPITTITKFISRDEDIFNFIDNNEIDHYVDINKDWILMTYSPKNNN